MGTLLVLHCTSDKIIPANIISNSRIPDNNDHLQTGQITPTHLEKASQRLVAYSFSIIVVDHRGECARRED